jgi:hypothetical protein
MVMITVHCLSFFGVLQHHHITTLNKHAYNTLNLSTVIFCIVMPGSLVGGINITSFLGLKIVQS